MGLSADGWHVLAICLFPTIDILGITASIFMSSTNNRTLLASGVIFSAGVLLSASLVHMLPHATETLDIYFAGEDNHDDHSGETEEEHALHDHGDDSFENELYSDHSGHDHLRLLRFLQDEHAEHEDSHAGHVHAFPWAQTIFAIAFIFLLMVEATMERIIDVYFSGAKGNFFHGHSHGIGHEEEEERLYKETMHAMEQERKLQPNGGAHSINHNDSNMPPDETEAGRDELIGMKDETNRHSTTHSEENYHDYGEALREEYGLGNGQHNPGAACNHGGHSHNHSHNVEGHSHDHNHSEAGHSHDHNHAGPMPTLVEGEINKEMMASTNNNAAEKGLAPLTMETAKPSMTDTSNAAAVPMMGSNVETETNSSSKDGDKEDTQPVAKPPGPMINIKLAYPDCKDCQMSMQLPLPDCKDCSQLTREDLGYCDEEVFHRHHHHATHQYSNASDSIKRRTSRKTNSIDGRSEKSSRNGLPRDMFVARRRGSGASNVSGKSSQWTKTAGRPTVVSYAVAPPTDDIDQQQTINPWVSILLTIVLSIHVILEGLTLGSSTDVKTLQSTFVAIAVHKVFAAFSLGSSMVASGYWEGNRAMFFLQAGTFVGVDIISIGTGMALSSVFEQNANVSGAVLQCLLGGSFLFVATVELIPGELEKTRMFNLPLFPILMSLCLGFALMTMLAKWGV